MKALTVLAVLVLPGCFGPPSAGDLAKALQSLGNDPATVCITVQGPWGTVTAVRANQPNTTVKGCNDLQHGVTP